MVGGTNPKKAGTDVDGIPVFANVAEAVARHRRHRVCIFIPAPGVKDAVIEAAEGGVEFIVVITEGVPAHDEAWFYNELKRDHPNVRLLGPNCPGIISPGKCNIGITAGHIAKAGGPGRHRQPLGHAHLPGALRAEAAGHRRHHLCRHRRRPGAGHELHRLPPGASRPTPRPRPS